MPTPDNTEFPLFQAVAFSLGLEILSGRLDERAKTPGYQQLLEQFGKMHPAFEPHTWKVLKEWLAHYNSPSDMSALLGPVLFQLNQPYLSEQLIQEELANLIEKNYELIDPSVYILDELALLIEKNHAVITPNTKWSDLVTHDAAASNLFPMLDTLKADEKTKLLTEIGKLNLSGINPKTLPNIKAFLKNSDISKVYIEILRTKIDFADTPIKWSALTKTHGAAVELFPMLDKLSAAEQSSILAAIEKTKIVKHIKAKIDGKASADIKGKSPADIKEFLERNDFAKKLVQNLKTSIDFDPILSKKLYTLTDLKRMADALHISLNEKGVAQSLADKRRKITLIKEIKSGKAHWTAEPMKADLDLFVASTRPNAPAPTPRTTPFIAPTKEEIDALVAKKILPHVELVDERIDNPGLGDCAYFSFAEGLIQIIQQEGKGNRRKFNEWLALDSSLGSVYGSVGALYDKICAFDFHKRDNELLGYLQSSLRKIQSNQEILHLKNQCVLVTAKDNFAVTYPDKASKAYKDALKHKYQKLVANSNYNDFATLYFTPDFVDPNFNKFATTELIKNAFTDEVRAEITAHENYEELVLVPLFIKLMYGQQQVLASITEATKVDDESPVIKSLRDTINASRNYWGTNTDLNLLAETFRVNLHLLEYGVDPRNSSVGDNLAFHTIVLDNLGNGHWETEIRFAVDHKAITPGNDPAAKDPVVPSPDTAKKTDPVVPSPDTAKRTDPVVPSPKAVKTSESAEKGSPKATKESDGKPAMAQPSASNLAGVSAVGATSGDDAKVSSGIKPKPLLRQRAGLLDGVELGSSSQPNVGTKQEHSDKPADIVRLEKLKDAVARVTVDYIKYNRSVWYSIFHWHGVTGRKRADKFSREFDLIKNYDEAKQKLIGFLNDDNDNGNTHPHSYRTMLLNQMFADTEGKKKPTLQETSDKFDAQLEQISTELDVNLDTLKQKI